MTQMERCDCFTKGHHYIPELKGDLFVTGYMVLNPGNKKRRVKSRRLNERDAVYGLGVGGCG